MKGFLGVLVLAIVVLPARAGDAPAGCAWLCGNWVLDAARSDPAEPAVDAALQNFKAPKPRRPPRPRPEDPWEQNEPDQSASARTPEVLTRTALRTQLLRELAAPASLIVRAQADVILIRAAGGDERRLYPGEPHSRVDAQGTTKISTSWRKDALAVREDSGRKRRVTETYALLPDGNLQLTHVIERPGLKTLHLRVMYRRGQTQALESATQGRPQDSVP